MTQNRWTGAVCAVGMLLLAVSAGGCVHIRNGIHNTLADAMDVVRLDLSMSWGTDMGAHVMLTEFVQLKSYSYESLHRSGLATRFLGTWVEDREDLWLGRWRVSDMQIRSRPLDGVSAAIPPKLRGSAEAEFARWGESPDEIGLGVHAFVLGLRAGVRPVELLDLLANLVGLDPCDDNLTWQERETLRKAEREGS